MFHFWYRFVPPNMSHIKFGQIDKFWRSVSRELPSFMLKVFEDICRQWIEQRNLSGRLPVRFTEIGRWWGVDPISKKETRVPIVAHADDENVLFGDCVWQDKPADAQVLISLFERSHLFKYKNRHLFLFSRSGFTDDCAHEAHRIGARLVMFE